MTSPSEIDVETLDEPAAPHETQEQAPDPMLARLPAPLREAFLARGYTTLTAVQRAVLDPALAHRDLRISSQTGSGKTAALGFVLAPLLEAAPIRASEYPPSPEHGGRAHMTGPREAGPRAKGPRALVLAPTRELARQLEEELSWLYGALHAHVAVLSGGASYRDEHRALARGPAVIVGTPGRLLDHLERGSFDPSAIEALVLDEADQMLDLGFADELEQILSRLPDERRTHLVSATFANDVLALADRIQRDPVSVEGTRLGAANEDIDHVVHLVDPHERLDALVNVLLAHVDARALVFTRTRAGAQEIAEHLHASGFRVAHLSGELAQRERTRTLAAFKDGTLSTLVATDVAARGIDVSDVSLVVHVDAPTSPDAYTHRAGRTGRAGRRGTSVVLATPRELATVSRVLARARIRCRVELLPDEAALERSLAAHASSALLDTDAEPSSRALAVVRGLPDGADLHAILARLIDRNGDVLGPTPRSVRVIRPPPPRERSDARRPMREPRSGLEPRAFEPSGARERDDVVPFVVTWGGRHGADPRRVLAMICRRGDITRAAIGAIHVAADHTVVEVLREAADHFLANAGRPDPRDPRVRIEPLSAPPRGEPRGARRGRPADVTPRSTARRPDPRTPKRGAPSPADEGGLIPRPPRPVEREEELGSASGGMKRPRRKG